MAYVQPLFEYWSAAGTRMGSGRTPSLPASGTQVPACQPSARGTPAWLALCLLLVPGLLLADGPVPGDFARRQYLAGKDDYRLNQQLSENCWKFAKACFDYAEYATNKTQRAALAEEGIAAANSAIEKKPGSAPAHYYLAMNLGQLARTRSLTALGLVDRMEASFLKAKELDASVDFAGPDRNLGQLYREAPSIASVGDRAKARVHLEAAARLAPNFPENRLQLAETYHDWGENAAAETELKAMDKLWPEARARLSGDAWSDSWRDWDQRRTRLRSQLELAKRTLKSPRH